MRREFAEKALVAVLLAAAGLVLLLALWKLRTLVLLIFAGILCAIFLRGLTNWVCHRTRLPKGFALALVVVLLLGLVTGLGFFLAPTLAQQSDELVSALPNSVQMLQERISHYSWGRELLREAPPPAQILPGPNDVLSTLGGAFTTIFGVLANLVIILFIGLFIAIAPQRLSARTGLHLSARETRSGGGSFSTKRGPRWSGG